MGIGMRVREQDETFPEGAEAVSRSTAAARWRRLAAMRDARSGAPLWISAPVGFGKTRLLAKWRRRTLDEGGASVVLDGSAPRPDRALRAALRSGADLVTVDDFWDTATPDERIAVLRAIGLSPAARVAITRRSALGPWEEEHTPTWASLGPADLAFSVQDCGEFFPAPPVAQLDKLLRTTGGWPVAVDLAIRIGRAAYRSDGFKADSPELNALAVYLEARAPGGDLSRLMRPARGDVGPDAGFFALLDRGVTAGEPALSSPASPVAPMLVPNEDSERLDDEAGLIGFVLRNGYEGLRRLLACIPFSDVLGSPHLRHGHTLLLCLDRFVDNDEIDELAPGAAADDPLTDAQRRIYGDGLQAPDFVQSLNELVSAGPATAPELLVLQRLYMGFSLQSAGDYPEAVKQLRQSLSLCQSYGYDFGRAIISLHLARIESISGPLEAARRRLVETRTLVRRMFKDERALLANLSLCSLALELDAGATGASAASLAEAGALVAEGKASFELFAVLTEVEAARAALGLTPPQVFAARLDGLGDGAGGSSERRTYLEVVDLLIRQATGDGPVLAAEAIALDERLHDRDVHWRLRDAATLARLWAEAEASPAKVAELAARQAASANLSGRTKSALRCLLVAAWCDRAAGCADWSVRLKEALALASASGIVLPFLERPALCFALIEAALEEPAFGDLLARSTARGLLDRLGALAERRSGPVLSRRECQVLTALRGGGSNKVIARSLGLTERTVKFHVANLARKLSTSGRKGVLDAATRQGLVG